MYRLLQSRLLSSTLLLLLSTQPFRTSATSASPFCDLTVGAIQNSQPLAGSAFIGNTVEAHPLRPKVEYSPPSANVHLDGGNTNSQDFPGPLGRNLSITSVNITVDLLFWDSHGKLIGAYDGLCNGSTTPQQAILALDPETLAVEADWLPPSVNTTLNFGYMQLLTDTDEVIVTSTQGQIFLLRRTGAGSKSKIELAHLIDLASETDLLHGLPLLSAFKDTAGDIWFATGAVEGVLGATAPPSTIVGYIAPSGTIHSMEVPNQFVENGISVSNTTIFINTSPSGADANQSIGYLAALQPGPDGTVATLWNITYDAGTKKKPGLFSRGSGSTPSLLGNDFVAITDNNDTQIHLAVYRQKATSVTNQVPVCKVPLFQPHGSANDNGPIAHFDGKDYGVVLQNMYNEPAYIPDPPANSAYHNLTRMSPGLTKIRVFGDGSGCQVDWNIPLRLTTLPVLSTATGLIYGYTQDKMLADNGHYVWYLTAVDYISGKVVWKARTGTGGPFDDNYKNVNLGPDGTMHQLVQDGVIIAKDGAH